LTLKAPKKVRAQPVVELSHEVLSQILVVFFESFEIPPLIRIKEVHDIE
jgi:hypothetical protein